MLKRGLGAPVIMAVGTAVALPVTAGVLTLVNACCSLLVDLALGGNQGFGQGLDHLSDFALSATVATGRERPARTGRCADHRAGRAGGPGHLVRAGPPGSACSTSRCSPYPSPLCGLYWGGTAHWIKRLVDLIIATILSQLVITMLMVLAAADLNKRPAAVRTPERSAGT